EGPPRRPARGGHDGRPLPLRPGRRARPRHRRPGPCERGGRRPGRHPLGLRGDAPRGRHGGDLRRAMGGASPVKVILATTDTARGGTPLKLATVARRVAQRGGHVTMVSLMPHGPVLDDLEAAAIPTASLDMRSPADVPRAVRDLRRLLRRERPDVLQTALFHANFLGVLAATGTGVPVVYG